MKIRFEDETIVFTDLDPLWIELLRRLPGCASADDELARRRLFPAPTKDEETAREWSEFVEPGLRELFRSHVTVVEDDLQRLRGQEEDAELRVPRNHAQAWLHTLNQARLALGARHNLSEEDLEGRRLPTNPETFFPLVQIQLYGEVLGTLLQKIEL